MSSFLFTASLIHSLRVSVECFEELTVYDAILVNK
jgi:hypothetical protein